MLQEIFYEHLQQAQPNEAHRVLPRREVRGLLQAVITENIDYLPGLAGSAERKCWTLNPLFKTQLGRNYKLHSCQADPYRLSIT